MKKLNNKEIEQTKKDIGKRLKIWKRMLNGDINALWECMYNQGMCNKEDLDEYHKKKK
ncbi:MAG: hypothetical protein KR126chlam4_01410 [Candidatus Anoxychlamydiales bacterium]|uniref:Uncharacterized protein n=1 Tax=marine sediment metagenome TaxID=412755 RepID=A0A0F9EZY8_9ZZZZ|nr:hypothetical protein [Candidatus Anoxychlamydiales bacterium]NGX41568.1 hypothetical protein [Candidatus Anoxychlamydiales bacterium]